MFAEIRYGITFGKLDSSDWLDRKIEPEHNTH